MMRWISNPLVPFNVTVLFFYKNKSLFLLKNFCYIIKSN
jgi:hypothetical protein